MSRFRKPIRILFAALFVVSISPSRSAAYFERFFVSSRTLSLGGAFIGVADDPSATTANPAGLAGMPSFGFLSSFAQPYQLPDLQESYLAAALPTDLGVFGLSWHRFALRGVTSEDVVSLAVGRDLIRTTQDASLSFGGSLDVARVAFEDVYGESKTVVTGSVSVLLRPFPIIGIGYNAKNLGQPAFDFVRGGGRTVLKATHGIGLAYHWERRYSFLYQWERGQDGAWRNGAGMEVLVGPSVKLRAGLGEGDVSGGVGFTVSAVHVDIGVASHEALGLSYLVSIGFSAPTKGEAHGLED